MEVISEGSSRPHLVTVGASEPKAIGVSEARAPLAVDVPIAVDLPEAIEVREARDVGTAVVGIA